MGLTLVGTWLNTLLGPEGSAGHGDMVLVGASGSSLRLSARVLSGGAAVVDRGRGPVVVCEGVGGVVV